jgi:hypothetical protein
MNVTYQGRVYRLTSAAAINWFCDAMERLKRLAA